MYSKLFLIIFFVLVGSFLVPTAVEAGEVCACHLRYVTTNDTGGNTTVCAEKSFSITMGNQSVDSALEAVTTEINSFRRAAGWSYTETQRRKWCGVFNPKTTTWMDYNIAGATGNFNATACANLSIRRRMFHEATRKHHVSITRCDVIESDELEDFEQEVGGGYIGIDFSLPDASALNKFPGQNFQGLFGRAIIFTTLSVTGTVALVMFIYAGLLWMFARGNSEQTKKAMQLMLWTSAGVIVMLASYSILRFVLEAMGAV